MGGGIKEYADDRADITRIYRHQLAACTFEVLPGPGKLLRWSVPASRGHDDLLISTALTARLDETRLAGQNSTRRFREVSRVVR